MGVKTSTIDAIKARPLSSVVEALGGDLKRVGREYVTHCLWHDDTNPSLTINDEKGFAFCHCCRAHCDAISYVQQRNGLDFRTAAETAAEMLGVPFEEDEENSEQARARREERLAAIGRLKVEQEKYKANIRDPRATRIRQILENRGLGAASAKEFGIGYASSGFFGSRITLPIYNHKKEIVGFTGRATTEDQNAKYKNSAESNLFQKRELVFNEPRAKEAARESGSLIFVEGHLDVVSMWQAGIKNVVAMQGTGAPDPSILKRLSLSAKNFILCYDGDMGGKKATEQFIAAAGPMAMKGECSINVVSLPDKKDPDEIIREGGDLYNYIANAPNWLDWVIDEWASALDKSDTAMITQVEKKLHNLIAGLNSKALRAHYIDKAARVLANTEAEAKKLASQWGDNRNAKIESEWNKREPGQIRLAAERRLIRTFVHCPSTRDDLRPVLEHLENPALRWLSKRLEELEQCSSVDLTPHSVMAVVAVAEPHFMDQLRPLIRPRVVIDTNEGVLNHLKHVILSEVAAF